MVGEICLLITVIGLVGGGIKQACDNHYYKENAKKRRAEGRNDANIWNDVYGCDRDLDTDEFRHIIWNGRLDRILTDQYGHVIRNIDQELRVKEAERKASEAPAGTKAVYLEYWDHNYSQICRKNVCGTMMEQVEGKIYKDIGTGELYIYRSFTWFSNDMAPILYGHAGAGEYCQASFYMDRSGYLVSLADGCHPDEEHMEYCMKFMRHFNQKQAEGGWAVNECNREHGFMGAFYCNKNKF